MKLERKEIEIEVHQGKIDYINYACNKEITYWKKVALDRVSTENEEKELTDLVPSRVSLIRKAKSAKQRTLMK